MSRRKRRTVAEYGPHPVDVHVGSRVRLRRTLLGMSQTSLGKALGLTFQQIQKNECGFNRIGASRIYQLSHVLNVPLSYFFDDMPELGPDAMPGLNETKRKDFEPSPMLKRETLELVRAYYCNRDPKMRDALRHMAIALAKSAGSP